MQYNLNLFSYKFTLIHLNSLEKCGQYKDIENIISRSCRKTMSDKNNAGKMRFGYLSSVSRGVFRTLKKVWSPFKDKLTNLLKSVSQGLDSTELYPSVLIRYDYFKAINDGFWSLEDAFIYFTKDKQSLTTEQRLSKFLNFSKEQEDPKVTKLLDDWGPFYKSQTKGNKKNQEDTNSVTTVNFAPSDNKDTTIHASGKRSQEEELPESQSKKSKTDSTFSIIPLSQLPIPTKSSIWNVWESFLYDVTSDKTLFYYSPLKYGIVTCGEGIVPHESIPKPDYKQLLDTNKMNGSSVSIIETFEDYINDIIEADTPKAMNVATRRLPSFKENESSCLFYLQDMFTIFARNVYTHTTDLSHSEAMYNEALIHPTLRSLVSSFENDLFTFIPGEEPLKSMGKIMKDKSSTYDDRNCYKADGIITYTINETQVELLLLETSSGYDQASNSKKAFDHHKAAFGLLAMLKIIADKYDMTTFDTFSRSKVYFVHAFGTQMRSWSLHFPSPGIYLLTREWSVVVPVLFSDRDPEISVNLF